VHRRPKSALEHRADWRTWRADTGKEPLATLVSARALEAGALIQTSREQGMLVLAPPLISSERDLERLVEALDHGLSVADKAELGRVGS
jgi:adenosylmethionine-8-amino-7-oxononanoate aminotransferase